MKIKPANGVRGHLLYIHDKHDSYVFRVYDSEHNFVDYDLLHCDLTVTIDDEDAYFYSDEQGNTLDHAPSTLGKEQ
jgi:hypothetical protein